jgi:RHS repeat-associated protein
MAFDDNGNLTTQTDAAGMTLYTWDARNRLTALTGPAVTASFAYDALGRRAQKTLNGLLTQFHYDGLDATRELGGGSEASYLRTLAIDEVLARTDAVDTLHYLADALGSSVGLITETGALNTTYTYEPFGRTAVDGPALNPFQYTGREHDGTGLYYYRERYHDPRLGRFINEDPIGLASRSTNLYAYVDSVGKVQTNLYEYADSSPINYVDPLGLFNWAKGATSLLNAANAGRLYATGMLKIGVAAGLVAAGPATGGISSLPAPLLAAWGTWNLNAGLNAQNRALQQWGEAKCESASQAAWKNLYGALPHGENFDDAAEPNPLDYYKDHVRQRGLGRLLSDFGWF